MSVVDRSLDRPAYKQIADALRAEIHGGALAPGARIPSEQQLVDAHRVSTGTVRNAVRLLAHEGLVRGEHGRGVFVCAQSSWAVPLAASALASRAQRIQELRDALLARLEVVPDSHDRAALRGGVEELAELARAKTELSP